MRRPHLRTITITALLLAGSAAPTNAAPPAQSPLNDWTVRHVDIEVLHAEIDDPATIAHFTEEVGGTVISTAPGVSLLSLPVAALGRLRKIVHGDVRPPQTVDVRPLSEAAPSEVGPGLAEAFGPTNGVQVGLTGADDWHTAGFTGAGVKIGVIDFFDITKYWDEAEHGPAPVANLTAFCRVAGADCTNEFYDGQNLGGEEHGVAVVEIIKDMAPDAEIFIGQAGTLTDYNDMIDWFVGNGVTIVNRSLGSRFDGPGDGRGTLDTIVQRAVDAGILWVNSGGNNGANRYYRHPVRLIGNQVAFGPSGDDTYLKFAGCVSLGGVRWVNDWDVPASVRTDYDLYLWESPNGSPGTGNVVDSSTRSQQAGADALETGIGSWCPSSGNALYLQIIWDGGDITGDVIEILDYGSGMTQFTQRAYSAAVSVVDSASPGVVAVGAVDPPQSGAIGSYSAQGPTNDGRIAPAIAAPAGFYSSVYNGSFSGTSASAPTVAGAAALLIDADLGARPEPLGDLIRNSTIDRGAAGPDNVFGHGEFRLPAPPDPAGIDTSPSKFVALDVPTRFLDTRPATAVGPSSLIGKLWRGEILDLPVANVGGVPAGASAVAVNVVSVNPDRRSYVQAMPTRQSTIGASANLNVDEAGDTRSNFAVIPVGDDGSISLYSIAEGHVVVDVLGWFEPAPSAVAAGRFVEFPTVTRLLDTRHDAPVAPLSSGKVRNVPMPTGVAAADVSALVVTVVAVAPTERGWLQAYPRDRPEVIGKSATINMTAGSNVANTAIVPVGGSGISLTASLANGGTTHVVVEAIGYITSSTTTASNAGRYVPVVPNRAYDSRKVGGPLADGAIATVNASDAPGVSVPNSASGVIWNLVIVNADRRGFLRGWAAGATEPTTASMNWSRNGETRSTAAVTAVTNGKARFRIEDGTINDPAPVGHFVVDVFGYFT